MVFKFSSIFFQLFLMVVRGIYQAFLRDGSRRTTDSCTALKSVSSSTIVCQRVDSPSSSALAFGPIFVSYRVLVPTLFINLAKCLICLWVWTDRATWSIRGCNIPLNQLISFHWSYSMNWWNTSLTAITSTDFKITCTDSKTMLPGQIIGSRE